MATACGAARWPQKPSDSRDLETFGAGATWRCAVGEGVVHPAAGSEHRVPSVVELDYSRRFKRGAAFIFSDAAVARASLSPARSC